MRNIFAVLALVLVTAVLGACGGSSSTNNLPVNERPAAADITPKATAPGTLLGGSVQGAVLPVFSNVSTVAGVAGTSGAVDGVGTLAKFYQPNGVTTDGKGNLFITDYWNHVIRKMELATGKVEIFAGLSGVGGSANTSDGTPPTFYFPNAITSDGAFLYVTDANFTVRKINLLDKTVTTLAGSAGNSGAIDHVTGSSARFNQLNGITNDAKYLYVTDSSNTIRWIDKVSGSVKTLAGSAGSVGSVDEIGEKARFNLPTRITCDGPNLYVCDFNNRTVRVIDIATGKVERIAGRTGVTGTPEALGTDSNLFDQPNGITTDGTYLYITDTNNSTVRRLLLADRSIVTIAGTAGSYGSIDGNVSAARFRYPVGITTDGKSIYITDSANHTIRRIY